MKRLLSVLLVLCLMVVQLTFVVEAEAYEQLTYKIVDGEVTITGYNGTLPENLTIPDTIEGYPVTAIGAKAFYRCKDLDAVMIPEGVREIGKEAFSGSWLTSVSIPNSVTIIGKFAFQGCSYLNYAVYDQGKYLGNESNPYIALCSRTSFDVVDFVIHPDTRIICDSAFYGCMSLKEIVIPAGVQYIGEGAFFEAMGLMNVYFRGDAPVFALVDGMCYDHEEDPWADLDFDFSAEHEAGPFEGVTANVYYFSDTSGWDQVTSTTMTGRGCGYTAPRGKLILKPTATTGLSGTLTAFGEGAVSLELISAKCTPCSLVTTEETYQLDHLIPGAYTLTVTQTGTVTRIYTLTVKEGENALDIMILQPGDINGDGHHNMGDLARMYAHVKKTKQLTDYELLCGDFTGDGKITVGDTAKVYDIIQNN